MKYVSSRIKQLSDEKDELIIEKESLEYELSIGGYPKLTEKELKPYIEGLHETLLDGTVAERKAFIRSFIKKIYIDFPIVEYTIPIDKEKKIDREVLIIKKTGCPHPATGKENNSCDLSEKPDSKDKNYSFGNMDWLGRGVKFRTNY